MPGRFAWVQYDFTPETVAEMLQAAKVPSGRGYANLEALAWHLNELVYAIGEPAPPRPEKIAAWCEEAATTADACEAKSRTIAAAAAGSRCGIASRPAATHNDCVSLRATQHRS
jgi:hypothetical protein